MATQRPQRIPVSYVSFHGVRKWRSVFGKGKFCSTDVLRVCLQTRVTTDLKVIFSNRKSNILNSKQTCLIGCIKMIMFLLKSISKFLKQFTGLLLKLTTFFVKCLWFFVLLCVLPTWDFVFIKEVYFNKVALCFYMINLKMSVNNCEPYIYIYILKNHIPDFVAAWFSPPLNLGSLVNCTG